MSNNLLTPQKISFHLSGGYNGEYPIDLRSTASFLLYTQQLIDKTYCVINAKQNISKNDKKSYKLLVKEFHVGSLGADLLLLTEGVALALPLLGFSNPKTLWDYTAYAFDLAQRFFTDIGNDKQPSIHVNGDNNTIIYNCGDMTTTYPLETYTIASSSIPTYRKLEQAQKNGQFTMFKAQNNDDSSPIISFPTNNDYSVFKEKTILDPAPIATKVTIFSFNRESMSGKLWYQEDTGNMEIPFDLHPSANIDLVIDSIKGYPIMATMQRAITYASFTPKIKRVTISSVEAI